MFQVYLSFVVNLSNVFLVQVPNFFYYYYYYCSSVRSLNMASLFSSSNHSCISDARQGFLLRNLTVFIRTSPFHLYLGFPVGFLPPKIFPIFVQRFFLSNIFTTCPAHFNLLSRRYTLFNKNQGAWNFLSPELKVTWRTVVIVIRVIFLSSHLCIRGVSLSSIH